MKIKEKIIESIVKATGLEAKHIHLETPEREEHGDYATNIALVMFGNDQFPISNFQSEDKTK